MASETPVSEHPATSPQQQEVEKDLESEVKDKAEAEYVSVPTDKEPPCPAPPPAATADQEKPKEDDKIVDKPIAPPAAAEEKKTEVADPPVIESTVEPPAAVEDKIPEAAHPSVIESTAEVQKETPKFAEERIETKTPAEKDKNEKIEDVVVPAEKPEAKLDVKGEEKHQELEKTAEPVKANEGELPPPKVVEPIEAKVVAVSEAVCTPIEAKVVAVSEAVCTPGEPVAPSEEAKLPQVVQQVEKEPPEDIKSSKVDEPCGAEGSNQIKAEEEKGVVEKASEKARKGEEVKEPAKEAIEVKEASEKKVELEAESKPKEVKPGERSLVVTELVQCDQKASDGVTSSKPAEKSAETQVASRDIEPVVDNGNKKSEMEASPETAKDVKVREAAAAVAAEAAKEPEKTEAAIGAKSEEEKRVDEPAKTDIEQSECNKDSQETMKITQDEPKGDPPMTKPHKPSLVKMMKQSLVKAKKAIIGKSNQSAKTPTPESKEQGNK